MEGTPFGRYILLQLLGRGGMGEVWRAHDTATGRVVALKLLPPHLAEDRVFQERFRREAYAAAALNEPHVIPIHNFGEIEGQLYVDMRLVEGSDLQSILAGGPLDPARAVTIVEQVAAALEAAHQTGLVHRDVKPSNILVAKYDFAYLIDFGIARAIDQTKLTHTGSTIGTLAYMAPERFGAAEPDARADVYALACVLYECLTGETPFPGDTVQRQVAGHLTTPPPRPSITRPGISPGFDAVIANGMAKDPEQRCQTTVDLANAARTALSTPIEQATVGATPDQHPTPTPVGGQTLSPAALPSAATHLRGPVDHSPHTTAPPMPADAAGQRRSPGRAGVIAAAVLAAVVLAAGIFAVVKLTDRQDGEAQAGTNNSRPAGPLDGTFSAEFGPKLFFTSGEPYTGSLISEPYEGTWSLRSACQAGACVATATLTNSKNDKPATFVFDEIDGQWVSVAVKPGKCGNVDAEIWSVLTLQPRPNGSLSGEHVEATVDHCVTKQTVTFSRTGDVEPTVGMADPQTQSPRLLSKAQWLRGRYHTTLTYLPAGNTDQRDEIALTHCLRTGDRCLTLIHKTDNIQVMVFANDRWTWLRENTQPCSVGGTEHVKITAYFALPTNPQDPIPLLTGHGRADSTGSGCTGTDFDQKFERTGD